MDADNANSLDELPDFYTTPRSIPLSRATSGNFSMIANLENINFLSRQNSGLNSIEDLSNLSHQNSQDKKRKRKALDITQENSEGFEDLEENKIISRQSSIRSEDFSSASDTSRGGYDLRSYGALRSKEK